MHMDNHHYYKHPNLARAWLYQLNVYPMNPVVDLNAWEVETQEAPSYCTCWYCSRLDRGKQ